MRSGADKIEIAFVLLALLAAAARLLGRDWPYLLLFAAGSLFLYYNLRAALAFRDWKEDPASAGAAFMLLLFAAFAAALTGLSWLRPEGATRALPVVLKGSAIAWGVLLARAVAARYAGSEKKQPPPKWFRGHLLRTAAWTAVAALLLRLLA